MSDKTTQETLTLLNQTLIHHKVWFNHFIRAIVCHLPIPQKECLLQSGINELDKLHEELHQQAITFEHAHKHPKASKKDYDHLITALHKFNTEIYTLQKKLEMSKEVQPTTTMTATMVTMMPILREQQMFAKRQLQTCYIALISIDLLNKIRDDYGVVVKDKVLITMAQFLVEQVRAYDKVFCYNDETFLVSFQNVSNEQAAELINRLRIKISKTPINIGLAEPLYVTVSCGVTALDPTFTMEQLLQQANIALYLAKKTGRNNTKSWGS